MEDANNECASKRPNNAPIPSISRPWPKDDTLEGARLVLHNIDNRINWLAALGLSPNINVLNRRNEVLEKVAQFERCLAPKNREDQ
jgi:hypothetical protein